jgi:hypothetical protein
LRASFLEFYGLRLPCNVGAIDFYPMLRVMNILDKRAIGGRCQGSFDGGEKTPGFKGLVEIGCDA